MTPAGMAPVLYAPSLGLVTCVMGDGEVVSLPASMVQTVWLDGAPYAFKPAIREAQLDLAVAELRDGDSA